MPKNANKTVYKEKEFQIYILWKSMPAYFRGMKKVQLKSYGFTDPLVLKIATIKNQTAFAKYFHIKDLGTLTDWNNKIKKNNLRNDTLQLALNAQSIDVNKKIILQPNTALEKKVSEQNKIISLLKKDNATYKRQLRMPPIKKNKKVVAPVQPPPLPTSTPQTLSTKILKIFFGWRKK